VVSNDVIRECIRGDRKAYSLLYKESIPYVYTIVKNYIRDEEDRRDVIQEIFAGVYTSLHRYDSSKAGFKTWISRVTINQCINFLRQTKNLSNLYSIETYIETQGDNAAHSLLNQLSKKDLENMLSHMPIGYKTVFLLSVLDEYDHKEIASMLNITAETSRSQLFRAIQWIKKNVFINLKDHHYGIEL
jgi:RNA polymerase sigma factor (sigma-70 family)